MAGSRSVLDDLGEEITGIMAPVSLCMAVTVLLVRLLNPDGQSSSSTVYIASLAYAEQVRWFALYIHTSKPWTMHLP
jgi:presenilin 1